MTRRACRFCHASLTLSFCDLGMSPLSNSYVEPSASQQMEPFYPLHAFVCEQCWLVQLEEFESPQEIFGDYAYFSSYSDSWLEHSKRYVDAAIGRQKLGAESLVIEIASNDGYLLQYFRAAGVPVLGIEPAGNVAAAAIAKGVPTISRFFGVSLARELSEEGRSADLIVANNVLAHVPDLNDFVAGLAKLLRPTGTLTLEFPHLLRLIRENQFDTIYHEHFSYFSFATARRVLAAHGLKVFDVEQIPTHGGSLRVYAAHETTGHDESARVRDLLDDELGQGIELAQTYRNFSEQVQRTKRSLLEFLIAAKKSGKRIVGYGAPAKGNTLLNYCGIRTDFLDFTVDRSEHKQGRLLPGTRIPILHPERIAEARPEYILILPWNLKDEIMAQMSEVRAWGGKFVVPIPEVTVL